MVPQQLMDGAADAATEREVPTPGPSTTFSIRPPEPFDFTKPHEWEKWIQRFERFRQASNLHTTTEENKVNTLVYCMGDEADDVLKGLKLCSNSNMPW